MPDLQGGMAAGEAGGVSPRDFSTAYRAEPIARAELRRTFTGNVWHVDRCPFCHRQHDYPAGGLDEDPRPFLGMRLSLCHRARWHLLEEAA